MWKGSMMSRSVKSIIALVVCAVLAACAFTAFGFSKSFGANTDRSAGGKVIFFNFKPEGKDIWIDVANEYKRINPGADIDVKTPQSNSYEDELRDAVKNNPDAMPTLFQINGPVGYAKWKDYTADLTNSPLYNQLSNKGLALTDNGKPVAVPYVTENYGLIYNKALLARYADLHNSKLKPEEDGVSFEDQITTFGKLKEVADDLQKRKDELGIDGAFTSAGFDSSSDWRFKTHLANMPLYYEFNGDTKQPAKIKGSYLDNFRKIFDLYISDSTTPVSQLSTKTGEDAVYEFALGKAVFYQNGTWAWGDLSKAGIKPDDVGMLPIYIGVPDEKNHGLAAGSENYWCINEKASPANKKATEDFLKWLLTSDYGKRALAEKMGFVTPFEGFSKIKVDNPLNQAAVEYANKEGKKPVKWVFVTMPSNGWKDDVGSDLLTYAQATKDGMTSIGAEKAWATLKSAFVDGWAKEYKIAHSKS